MRKQINNLKRVSSFYLKNQSLRFLIVAAAPAKKATYKLTNALDGFADAFAGFGNAVLNGLRDMEAMKRAIGSRSGTRDERFFKSLGTRGIGEKQALWINA